MRKLNCIAASLLIAGYLLADRRDWFTTLAASAVMRNPLYTDTIDLRAPGPIIWKVPTDTWAFKEGRAQLSLVLNLHSLREIPQDRSAVELRVKIAAYWVRGDGSHEDRLIRDS